MQSEEDRNPKKEDSKELLSINEVIAMHRSAYPNRNKWLFKTHIVLLISWLVFRYAIVRPVLVYIKDLIADIKRGL